MKEIIFVRHAKSDWGSELLKDVDRPLAERGYDDAYFSSQWYASNQPTPDLILSSTATRALSTALIFARRLELDTEKLQLDAGIYESSADNLFTVIGRQPASVNRLMLFGHNPGFTDICNSITEDFYFDNMPTCGIISFHLDIRKWSERFSKKGKLNYYQFPKDFKNRH